MNQAVVAFVVECFVHTLVENGLILDAFTAVPPLTQITLSGVPPFSPSLLVA